MIRESYREMNPISTSYNFFFIIVALLVIFTGYSQDTNASKDNISKSDLSDFVFSLPFNSHIADLVNQAKSFTNDIIPFP